MSSPDFSLVFNLSDRVTWVPAMLAAARQQRIACLRDPDEDQTGTVVYLGDRLPPPAAGRREFYFLAACSLPPNDEGDWWLEASNIERAAGTLLVSEAERTKVAAAVPRLASRLHVVGAPLSLPAETRRDRFPRHRGDPVICFAGQPRAVKNPELEVAVIRALSARGYRCIHLATRACSWSERFEAAGAAVVIAEERGQFLSMLARAHVFVATSFWESLCLTGLEATALGVVPVVPDHGGFRDWCPSSHRYAPLTARAAVATIEALLAGRRVRPTRASVAFYHPHRVFARIGAIVRSLATADTPGLPDRAAERGARPALARRVP